MLKSFLIKLTKEGRLLSDLPLQYAVLVPFIKLKDELFIILEKRSPYISQGGEIAFPGGKFDIKYDQVLEDTAQRETSEELGIKKSSIDMIGSYGVISSSMEKQVSIHLGIINLDTKLDFSPYQPEVDKIIFLNVKKLLPNLFEKYCVKTTYTTEIISQDGKLKKLFPVEELGISNNYKDNWSHLHHKIYVLREQKEIIWGMTAKILYFLSKDFEDFSNLNQKRDLIDILRKK